MATVASSILVRNYFEFEVIVGTALRDHPEEEIFSKWLIGPKPNKVRELVMGNDALISRLADLYPCGPRLHILLIRSNQSICDMPWDIKKTGRYLTKKYIVWHRRRQRYGDFDYVCGEREMIWVTQPILPENLLKKLGERYPTASSVVELCNQYGINHKVTRNGQEHSVFEHLLHDSHRYTGFDLWTLVYFGSKNGSSVRFGDLKCAAMVAIEDRRWKK